MGALIAFLTKVFLVIISYRVIKFFIMACILFSASEIVVLLIDIYAPEFSSICNLLASVPPGIGFFLQYFEIDFAVHTVLTAYVMRFAIRRLPFVGG